MIERLSLKQTKAFWLFLQKKTGFLNFGRASRIATTRLWLDPAMKLADERDADMAVADQLF
jgi:hypothetical protein